MKEGAAMTQDRFEQIVNKRAGPRGQGLTRWEAMDLLRRQHAAFRRKVRAVQQDCESAASAHYTATKIKGDTVDKLYYRADGAIYSCQSLLDWLDRRRRGEER